MTRNMKTTLASLFLFGSLSVSAFASTMTTMNGKSTKLSDYMGKDKWTVVEAWHSTCNICMETMPDMVKAKGSFTDARLIGISLDGDITKAREIVKRFDINFPTLLTGIEAFDDYLHKVADTKLVGVPLYLIFSPQGELKAMQKGHISVAELHASLNTLKASKLATLKQTLAEQIIDNQGEIENFKVD